MTRDKNCHCFTCGRDFHPQGIMRHRAMHRDRREDCRIEYGDGRIFRHAFGPRRQAEVQPHSEEDDV